MSDVSNLFFARSILLAMLASTTLPAQEADEHRRSTSNSSTSVDLPSLDNVMARFKEIESSYLPFHLQVIETRGLRNGNADFGAARHSLEDGYRRMQYAFRDGQSWMQESTFIARGRIATTNRITCSGGSIVRRPQQAVNDGSVANPLAGPLAGLFPLMSHPEYPTLVSDLYKSNPARFTMQRDGNIARIMIEADAVDRDSQRVELWLSEAHKWHPIRMQRFANSSDKSIEADWAITTLRISQDNVRIAAGRCGSAWGRLKQGEDHTAAVFVVTDFEVEASAYGDQVSDDVYSSDTLPGQSALESFEPKHGSNVFVFVPSNNEVQEAVQKLITDGKFPAGAKSVNPLAAGDWEKPTADAHARSQGSPGMNGGDNSPFGGGRSGSTGSSVPSPPSSAPVSTAAVEEEQLKIFHLQNGNAKETSQVIEQLFGGPLVTLAVDARTNSLIVRSNEPLLQQIEAILLRLDEQPGKQAPIGSSTTGTNANSAITIMPDPTSTSELPIVPIAEYRRRLNELELPLLQLAEKVRSTEASLGKEHPESLKQRDDLRESIQKTFAARQEIQRAELAEFTRRLQHMQQSIDARDRIADKIVDRRLEEFLNPEADWNLPLSARLEDSKSKVVLSEAKAATKYVRLPTHLFGTWAVEELSIKSAGIDISTINPKPRLTVTADHLVVPMDGGITITMQYELIEGHPLRANLTFDGSHARTFGIIKYSNESLWLCFREPADKGEPALTESNRPIDFLPGDKYYCIKCRKSSPVSETKAGPSTQLEPRIEPDIHPFLN